MLSVLDLSCEIWCWTNLVWRKGPPADTSPDMHRVWRTLHSVEQECANTDERVIDCQMMQNVWDFWPFCGLCFWLLLFGGLFFVCGAFLFGWVWFFLSKNGVLGMVNEMLIGLEQGYSSDFSSTWRNPNSAICTNSILQHLRPGAEGLRQVKEKRMYTNSVC